jgi:hypothetical protein
MKESKIIWLYFLTISVFTGCEKETEIELPESVSQLVVEGWIEQNKVPKVLLSLSAPYFTSVDSNNLRDYAVTQAKVTVTGPEGSEVLTLRPNDAYFPPYYYFGINMKGQQNSIYQLQIEFRNKTYSATTTIPSLVTPDSIWFAKNSDIDTLGLIKLRFTDNQGETNYYQTFTKRIGQDKRFVPTFTSVFSDESFNGKTLEISLSKGNTNLLDIGSDRFFRIGDTIIVRFCSLDKTHYNFWKTYQDQVLSSGNPFSVSNTGLESNIENALGIWGGYAASYDTIIAK